MKTIFTPNDSRKPIEVSSLDDIRKYMGNALDGFDTLEEHDGYVLAGLAGDSVCIGKIETKL